MTKISDATCTNLHKPVRVGGWGKPSRRVGEADSEHVQVDDRCVSDVFAVKYSILTQHYRYYI